MLGPTLRSLRTRCGLTQADIAAISGIAQANVSAIERGRRTPSIATLTQLLDACGARLVAVVDDESFPIAGDGVSSHGDLDQRSKPAWSDEDRGRMLVAALEVSEVIERSR